ncbi:lysophospholipase L1-like esterase [Desulfobaculum xiamenense]|uniref:Lysophospholipase L1-like esterase n=1 Tax=Desulfobaculum xiamenense TaxID=995050 RepID=A0A846QP31_9BACT|nr:GDSL-type esterase/lipase family protein [Desulfobaculum xiamenense]NJB68232.1 lysophospholipase L1-like esterase [Desulfobaculum xiamenense]
MVICFFGDSLVNGTRDAECLGWPGRLCAPHIAAGLDLTYYNLGVRRDASAQILARWRGELERRELQGLRTRLVFSYGVGDMAMAGSRPRATADEAAENTQILLEAARGYDTLFVGPPPVSDPGHTARISELSMRLGTVCARFGVPYFDMVGRLGGDAHYIADVRASDGIHPRSAGYARMARLLVEWPGWREWFD